MQTGRLEQCRLFCRNNQGKAFLQVRSLVLFRSCQVRGFHTNTNGHTFLDVVAASLQDVSISLNNLNRYWNRELVEAIAASEFIHPGTIFAISHFGIPSKQGQWKFPYPKVRETCVIMNVW